CPPRLDDRQRSLLALAAEHTVQVNPLPDEGMFEIVVVSADQVGLLAVTAGVLALNRLDIRRASARSADGRALLQAAVAAPHGRVPEEAKLLADLRAALAGTLDIAERLAARERDYSGAKQWTTPGPPQVIFDDGLGSTTVLEVRAPDRAGVLFRIVRALSELRLDVATAIVATLGLDVVDAFYVQEADGRPVADDTRRREIARAVLAALGVEDLPDQPAPPAERASSAGSVGSAGSVDSAGQRL
ncbi:ACT domain-containing protein, partial [Frankia sp. AvcI1]